MILKQIFKSPYFYVNLLLGLGCYLYFSNQHFFPSHNLNAITKDDLSTKLDIEQIQAQCNNNQPLANTHELGFQNLTKELQQAPLKVKGNFPSWLKGSFVTIGPAIFEVGSSKAGHWLDGLAMAHRFDIKNDDVVYSNKTINSSYFRECCKKGKIKGSTPEQKKSTWSKLTSALSSTPRPIYDNTNINIACFNNQICALTETPYPLPLDSKTLETKEYFKFNDKIEAHFSCAHPIFDPSSQQWYGIAIQYAHTSNYLIYTMKKDSTTRTIVATIPAGYPTYVHSFGLTKNYVILTETPFIVSPYDLLLSDSSFIENFNWKPKNGSTFTLIDKKTGQKIGTFKTESFFTLHHVNASEKEGKIIADLVAYKDPEIIKSFYLKHLCSPKAQLPAGQLKRFVIDPAAKKVTSTLLCPHNIELPQINPAKIMQDYQYVYATCTEHGLSQQLIKLDLRSAQHQTWHCKECYTTEPIFVAKPNAVDEDDGVVLSLVLDVPTQKSFLLVLDAKTMKELGRAYVSHHIPFTVHSKFFN